MARLTTFKFALDLTPEQDQDCRRYAGAARKAWNFGLALVKQQMDERREEIDKGQFAFTEVQVSRNQLIPAFNAFKLGEKGEHDGIASWYKQVSKYCFEEALVDLSRSLSAFYKGAGASRKVGFPSWRKRGTADSFRLRAVPHGAIRLGEAETARWVKLPKLGWLKVFDDTRRLRRLMRPLPDGTVRSCRHKVAAGRAETLNAGGGGSSGRAGSSRFCETTPDETGTVLVEKSAGTGQLRKLP